ncbi:MAG TPA: SHOCT domain-containing protein [Rhizomicrobium sp.]|nr:SHOCT domain-containing protein [Rhizomicrobium sp.]
MRDAIQAQIDAHYARASQPAVHAPSAADELEKFAGLHAKGLITDEEFAAKKKQILGL